MFFGQLGENAMAHPERDLVERIHREALEQLVTEPNTERPERQEGPEVDLPRAVPGNPFAEEWELFRRQVGQLLADGGRGRSAATA
jgi:hypothetical protein